jgi:hypothetical protein
MNRSEQEFRPIYRRKSSECQMTDFAYFMKRALCRPDSAKSTPEMRSGSLNTPDYTFFRGIWSRSDQMVS